MNGDLWIVIPNWDRFQHYKDRDPTWIKLYAELNSRDDWRRLTFAERGLLVSLWVEYARSGGRLRVASVCASVSTSVGAKRNVMRLLESLYRAGFIQFSASAPLALARSREKRRVEKNERASTQTPKPGPNGTEPRPAAAAYQPFQQPDHEPHLDRAAALELARLLAQP